MIGWTLLDAILGGDAEALAGVTDAELPLEDGEGEGEVVLPDYAESPDAVRRREVASRPDALGAGR
jgi:hypothetical protein